MNTLSKNEVLELSIKASAVYERLRELHQSPSLFLEDRLAVGEALDGLVEVVIGLQNEAAPFAQEKSRRGLATPAAQPRTENDQ
jgi:hypothetical protein